MKGSDNNFPKVLLDMQTSDPSAPADEDWKLYAKPGGIYARSSNAIVGPFIGSGSLSAGSNSTAVAGQTAIGGTTTYAPAAHWHEGVFSVTASSSNTLQRPVVNLRPGSNVSFALSDSDGSGAFDTLTIGSTASAAGGGGALVDSDAKSRSSGNVTLNSGSWANVDTGVDLVVNASAGDLLQVSVSGRLAAGGADTHTVFDFATIVGGSPVNYFGTAGGASDEGLNGLYARDAIDSALSGSFNYIVQAGDISSGTVTVRLRYRQPGTAGNRTFVAGSVNPFKWWAINLGQ